MNILLSGATGLIGGELAARLHDGGHNIIVLTTRKKLPENLATVADGFVSWDSNYRINEPAKLAEIDSVIHLAGASVVGKRWNAAYKAEILNSRTASTAAIIDAFKSINHFPKTFICASATGFYGSRKDEILTEASSKGTGFLSDVCSSWEDAARQSEKYGARWVSVRTGIVLTTKGGALPQMLLPFRLFVGGHLGSGKQWFSWISLEDTCAIFAYVLENNQASGVYNAVAPHPVQMKELAKVIGKTLHRPSLFPVPGFVLQAVMGEASVEITKSQRVLPARLTDAGYQFKFSDITYALKEITGRGL